MNQPVTFAPWYGEHPNLQYVVIMARYREQWLFVRHHQRETWEIPGGKIEHGESPLAAAHRELIEETGAQQFNLSVVDVYQVGSNGRHTAGLLCFAQIEQLGELPAGSEIGEVTAMTDCPALRDMTWAAIQPHLFQHVAKRTRLLTRLQRYQHVIWDWNGTLVNDSPLATDIVNELMAEQALGQISHREYQQGFCHPIADYYRGLGFNFEQLPYPELCQRFGQAYSARRDQLALHPGSSFLLDTLRHSHCQSILSASSQHSLDQCLSHHGISHCFDYAFGQHDSLALSKLERGKQLLETSTVCPTQTVMIGDTDHDIEVAAALGVDLILIADGHQDHARLSQWHHDVLPGWAEAA